MLPKLLGTSDYINWYFDQAGAWIGFITAFILILIFIKKLHCCGDKNEKNLKFWIYSLYFSHLFFMISTCCQVSLLPILKSLNIYIDQQVACKVILVHMHIFASWYHISIFNIFIQRLYTLCLGSIFQITKHRVIVIRTTHLILWIIIGVSSAFITDPSPYNVYTSSIDLDSGYTCSLFTSTKVDFDTTIVLMSAGMAIFGGNIFAWVYSCKNSRKSSNLSAMDHQGILRARTKIFVGSYANRH